MTTNIDLINMAQKNKIRLDYIIYKDEIFKIPYSSGLSIIINMSSTGHAGTHWVSLYTDKDKTYYFDSFGDIPPQEVLSWSNKGLSQNDNPKPIVFNDYQIQHFSSEMCGEHSIGFLGLMQGKSASSLKALLDDKVFPSGNTNPLT